MDYQQIPLPTRGKVYNAIYIEQQIPAYKGNPLIEALPRILSTKEAIKELAYYPAYDESMRELPSELRYQILEDIVRFFTPLSIHYDLERRIARLIRTGLIERNPVKTLFWQKNKKRVTQVNNHPISQYGNNNDFHSTSAYGFNLIGVSGVGKSLAVERCLRLMPQVIHHKKYKSRRFTFSQIAWLKIDCPFDGGLKGLCINFFQTVDSILGTSYHKNYASKSRNTDEMLPYMALVAANHGIGVLVIDEIQRLSLAKSGGIEKMLNFFVQIVNTVGVPMILVGTYKSLSIFDGNFSQMRRGTGQGDMVWDRMKNDKEWKLFVKALWHFQYTQKVSTLTENPELFDALYEETQGITDLAVKAYMLAQERAIETGIELVTASIIHSVCRDKFRIIRPALEALKGKTKNALTRFEDAYPQFLDQFITDAKKHSGDESYTPQIEGEISNNPVIRALNKADENGLSSKENKKSDSDFFKESQAVLPKIHNSVSTVTSKSIHTALNEAGFIRPATEFITGAHSV